MKKCVYLTEGECEAKLIKALKVNPALIVSGKVKCFNVIQNVLPANMLMQFAPGSRVVLVFDTDKKETSVLEKNIRLLKDAKLKLEMLTIMQVLNFEDEIERATDVTRVCELTRCKTVEDFKHDVNRMRDTEFRNLLKRHKLDMSLLWSKKASKEFDFAEQDGARIKLT